MIVCVSVGQNYQYFLSLKSFTIQQDTLLSSAKAISSSDKMPK